MSVPTNPGQGDDRAGLARDIPVSASHGGLMPKLGAATATRGALSLTGYGRAATIEVDPATASVAGALTAAGYSKLANWPKTRLAYTAAANLASGLAVAAATWTDLVPAQSFTVNSATAYLEVVVRLKCEASSAAANVVSARLTIDAGAFGTKLLSGDSYAAGGFGQLGGGAWWVTGLLAGAHTVGVQLYGTGAFTANCRPVLVPNSEFASIDIVEVSP